jgi:hypothetical protein
MQNKQKYIHDFSTSFSHNHERLTTVVPQPRESPNTDGIPLIDLDLDEIF